jgi:hypothetical protein
MASAAQRRAAMFRWLLPVCAVLAAPCADAQYRAGYASYDDPADAGWWLGVGLGTGSITSAAPAPSAKRDGFAANLDLGYRLTPTWGLGFEIGVVAPTSGCGASHCAPNDPDFAPNFAHWFVVSEWRPGNAGWRLRASAGLSTMCYDHYYSDTGWGTFWNVVLFGDLQVGSVGSTRCRNLSALGGALSVGYQWPLGDSGTSMGLQLRGEAANFAASSQAGLPAFHHRALVLLLQLNVN